MRGLLVAFAFLLYLLYRVTTASAQAPSSAPDSFTLAHRAVSTESIEAQAAFDDGLTLLYAFNPQQARRSFERATAADPALAIAWWGVAMSHGPNINTEYDPAEAKRGNAAIVRATGSAMRASPVERALIDATAQRFARTGAKDGDAAARAYRDAMVAVADRFPADDDVQAFAAEAGLDARPWDYYQSDGSPEPGTAEIVIRLQRVLARDPAHIGAEHFLIHATEASAHPELALDGARRLVADRFEPAAEHLIHMPAHTFMRVGDYHEAGEANARAIAAYQLYLARDPAEHGEYFGHDCLFGVDAFITSGEYRRAISLGQECGSLGAGTFLSRIADMRFRKWDALAQAPAADDFVGAMLALHRGKTMQAIKRSAELVKQGSATAHIASDVLLAGVARVKNDPDAEVRALRLAVSAQDGAGYSEPPAFWYPVRESLGAAYFRDGRYGDAVATFRAELAKDPSDPRALFGLAESLDRAGDADGARDARARYRNAWAYADAPLSNDDL